MPDYDVHLWLARKVGIAVGLLLTLVAFVGGVLDPALSGILTVFSFSVILGIIGYYSTIVGGAAPDIDLSRPRESLSTSSIPYRQLVRMLQLLVMIVVLFGYARYVWQGAVLTQAIGAIIVAGIAIVFARIIPDILHRYMPAHRTTTHSLVFWVAAGLVIVWLIRQILTWVQAEPVVKTYLPIAVGLPVFLGVVTHISADIVSNYVRDYAPSTVKQRAAQVAPWVPKRKPILFDIPRLARVLFDRSAPISIRFLVLLTAVYGMLPLDLITDFIPIIGWTDDLGLYLGMRSTVYNSYENDEGLLENLQRRTTTVLKLYVPVLILSFVALVAIYFLILA